MQVKTVSYKYTPIRIAKIKIVTIPNTIEEIEELNHSYIPGGTMKWYDHSGKSFASVLKY